MPAGVRAGADQDQGPDHRLRQMRVPGQELLLLDLGLQQHPQEGVRQQEEDQDPPDLTRADPDQGIPDPPEALAQDTPGPGLPLPVGNLGILRLTVGDPAIPLPRVGGQSEVQRSLQPVTLEPEGHPNRRCTSPDQGAVGPTEAPPGVPHL